MRGTKQFEDVLGIKWEAVPSLLTCEAYRVWINSKGREIQAPIHRMAFVHERIGRLLRRIEVPNYVYSQKGRSYVDNTLQHLGEQSVIKTDIHKFYPSVTRAMVFRMFFQDFECAADIADRLADICCYKQAHLPTGSPLSGHASFFAARKLFDDIAKLATSAGCKFTLYVDDIVLSGTNANLQLLGQVRMLISRHGLKSKGNKSKSFAPSMPKCVTGAVIVGDELRLPNARHLKLHRTRRSLERADGEQRVKLKREFKGREQEAAQVLRRQSTLR